MPRAARKASRSGLYHVLLRGINRQQIFADDEDNEKFLQVLTDCKEASGFQCHAYCLMGNHIHLLLEVGREPLGQVFRRIGARYVYWYNWKYDRSGHLFQDRYKSIAVEDDPYLLSVVRHIHQNPVKGGLVKEAKDYKWSSAMCYLSGGDRLVDPSFVLSLFAGNPATQLASYTAYLHEAENMAHLENDVLKRLSDPDAREMMERVCGTSTVARFQAIPPAKRDAFLKELYEQGISIRQLARLTGISVALVRKVM